MQISIAKVSRKQLTPLVSRVRVPLHSLCLLSLLHLLTLLNRLKMSHREYAHLFLHDIWRSQPLVQAALG